jgi:hypothetical protein
MGAVIARSGAALSSSRRDAALLPADAQPSTPIALREAAARIGRLMDAGWLFEWDGHEDAIIEAFEALDAALDDAAQGWIGVQHNKDQSLEPPGYPLLRAPVLVTIQDAALRYISISAWSGQRWIGVEAPDQVIAWMPMIEPAPTIGATEGGDHEGH